MINTKIKCPHCGAEYLPSEIFIPSDFLPKVEDLVKDEEGHIIAGYEHAMNLHEEYTCDYCNHRFAIMAEVAFKTEVNLLHDYNFNHESNLYPEGRAELLEE